MKTFKQLYNLTLRLFWRLISHWNQIPKKLVSLLWLKLRNRLVNKTSQLTLNKKKKLRSWKKLFQNKKNQRNYRIIRRISMVIIITVIIGIMVIVIGIMAITRIPMDKFHLISHPNIIPDTKRCSIGWNISGISRYRPKWMKEWKCSFHAFGLSFNKQTQLNYSLLKILLCTVILSANLAMLHPLLVSDTNA